MVDMTAPEIRRFDAAMAAKRGIDVSLATAALLAASPVLAALWLFLLLDGGAPIFSQTRIGQGGRRFRCLKFRTMRLRAEAELPALIGGEDAMSQDWALRQKLVDDPRVTPLGAHLRRWGLDELPQLVNVLRGEMSLIGPRPITAPEVEGHGADRAYAAGADFHHYVAMRPGVTGLWQVAGGAERPYRHRIDCDRAYVENWSLRLDLAILVRTPLALMRRRSG